LGMQNNGATLTQNILPDTLYYINQYTRQRSLNQQHAFNGKWEWKPDSMTTLKLTTVLSHRVQDFETATDAESLSEERRFVNTSSRVNEGRTEKRDADNNLTFKRTFKKQGRLLNASLRLRYTEDELNGFLRFENRFYKGNVIDSTASADQQKINDNASTTLGGKLTYAEPLNAKWTAFFTYAYNQNDAVSRRNTFDRSAAGKYENRNLVFSNNFDMKATGHSGSVMARYATKKLKFGIGSGASGTRFNLLNLDSNRRYDFRFLNLTPQGYFQYSPQQNTNIHLNYNGSTVQPNIEQLQPLRNNADPLNIVLGNPALGVGFRHSINVNYFSYKMLKQIGLWSGAGYNVTKNAISNRTTIDAKGLRTTQAVNVDGNSNWYVWGEWNKGEGEKKLIYTVNVNANGSTYNNFINGLSNRTRSFNFVMGLGLRYEVDNKWMLSVRPKGGPNRSVSSLNPKASTNFLSYGGNAEGRVNLPWKLELQSELELDWRQRIAGFDANPNITYWKGELRKKVFKNNTGIISLVANDILNSYRGINRVINSNFITEERYQRVGQYFQLKLEWSFNKMGGEK
ncbi:MAG TPA: outer membrane beta-barrel protein, partial [Flavisolibacter sp.]|nr:outer membrane beta-barrel protein [Flavisolibacter sp.]